VSATRFVAEKEAGNMARAAVAGRLGTRSGARDLVKDFRDFMLKHNFLGLAVAVVLGAAVGKVVAGVVEDVVMPIVGVILPGGDWRSAQWVLSGGNAIKYGDLVGRIIEFLAVAVVVFAVVKVVLERDAKPEPATKACPECLELVPAAARRCRACGSAFA
jgi:large conductance mechanosensitive channel